MRCWPEIDCQYRDYIYIVHFYEELLWPSCASLVSNSSNGPFFRDTNIVLSRKLCLSCKWYAFGFTSYIHKTELAGLIDKECSYSNNNPMD